MTVFNRLTLNKMLANKPCTFPVGSYEWLDPLGESDAVRRETYTRNHEDFIARARRFGRERRTRFGFKTRAREPDATQRQVKHDFTDGRAAEWITYKEKLSSHHEHEFGGLLQPEPLGFRERSVRMNHIDKSDHDFDPNPDETWCLRTRAYNRFLNVVYRIMIKNRLEKRLDIFKTLTVDDVMETL